ncbi:FAD binding domain-containing protein [Actinoplanes sp. CA-142083]|uniref:FAD binding domain-containing protein n=1 Tax=Actinoplanes sp. CA-142083 TaxID=3239903 RepID=UPI003D8CBD47
MIPVAFDYLRPAGVDDAVAALAEAGDDAKILAGGQSLLPVLRLRLSAPSVLVDLGGVAQLRGVREEGDSLVIGAMTTHDEVATSPLVRRYAPLLATVAATIGDRQIRHRGTLGGSLAHADPAADLPAAAATLEARYVLAGPSGRRTVTAADFAVDLFTTALADDEVLVEVQVPKVEGWGSHYEKFHHVVQSWAIVGVAAMVKRADGGIESARVTLTNMGPTALRATAVEQALTGCAADPAAINEACMAAAEGTSPRDDVTASAEYRRHLVRILTGRAVTAAAGV